MAGAAKTTASSAVSTLADYECADIGSRPIEHKAAFNLCANLIQVIIVPITEILGTSLEILLRSRNDLIFLYVLL